MRLALIPPIAHEAFMLRSNTHMALAHIPCMENTNRTIQYRKARERGDYIILDNGANEGPLATPRSIKEYGGLIGADEIVLPDKLDSLQLTLRAVKTFITMEPNVWGKFQRRMAVVQATSVATAMQLVGNYADIEAVNVIGLPRRIIDNIMIQTVRIDLANTIDKHFPGRFQIHFLGAHPMWPKEIKYASKYCVARSMDTSLPFNWSIAGKKIDEGVPGGVGRPTGYFGRVRDISTSLLDHNIGTALEWARGETTPSS